MLYSIIADCIEGELLHGFNLNKEEINNYFKKLESDNRFSILKGGYLFYKENSIQDILKDYPELDEVIKDHDSLDSYIEDKYQEEDIEIGNKMATINIDYLDLVGLILCGIKEYTDEELFNNLENAIKDVEKLAKFSLIRQSFQGLFNEVEKYSNEEGNNAYINWDIIKDDIPKEMIVVPLR